MKRTGDNIAADGKKSSLDLHGEVRRQVLSRHGSDLYDELALKKIDDHNAEATMRTGGKVCG